MIEIDLRQKRGSSKDHSLNMKEREILEKELTAKNKIIYLLGAYAGLRVTEIEQMRFSWLEWKTINDKKVLAINLPNQDRNILNKLKQFKTKNRNSRTTYIFNIEFAQNIFTWYEINKDGIQMTRQAIHQRVKNWNKYLNRENNNLHCHALRSTAQNIWKFELGFDDIFIQLCFGWKDLNTMVQHYRTMNVSSGESYLYSKLGGERR